MKKTLLCIALAGLLSACGGSDDNASTPPANNVGTQTGVLTDGIISGVTYITSSGATGVTNEKGEFKFNQDLRTIIYRFSVVADDFYRE